MQGHSTTLRMIQTVLRFSRKLKDHALFRRLRDMAESNGLGPCAVLAHIRITYVGFSVGAQRSCKLVSIALLQLYFLPPSGL